MILNLDNFNTLLSSFSSSSGRLAILASMSIISSTVGGKKFLSSLSRMQNQPHIFFLIFRLRRLQQHALSFKFVFKLPSSNSDHECTAAGVRSVPSRGATIAALYRCSAGQIPLYPVLNQHPKAAADCILSTSPDFYFD